MKAVATAVQAAPEWIETAKTTDWLSSLRPWPQFVGLGEASPYQLSTPSAAAGRLAANLTTYLSNYVFVTLVVCLFTAATHLMATIVVAVAAFLGYRLVAYVQKANVSFNVAGRRIGAEHISAIVGVSLLICVIFTFGTIVFTFVGIATTIIVLHALIRRPAPRADAVANGEGKHSASLDAAESGAVRGGRSSPVASSMPPAGVHPGARTRHLPDLPTADAPL